MATWTDSTGQDWVIAVNVSTARRVKELAGIDVLDVFDGALLARLSVDPVALVDVLYGLCSRKADERGLTYEQFAERTTGDALESAVPTIVQAITDFFPSGRREVLRRLWERVRMADEAAVKLATEKIDSETVTAAIQRTMANAEAEIDRRLSEFGGGSTNAPEYADLIQEC